jgi:hypothetical protein
MTRKLIVSALLTALFVGLGCKSKVDQQTEEAKAIIAQREPLRERLRLRKMEREAKAKWLKEHPEILEGPIEPDEAHRPLVSPNPNLSPQLMGAAPAMGQDPRSLIPPEMAGAPAANSAAPKAPSSKGSRL